MCRALSSHQASNARCLHEPASVTVTRNSGSAHAKAFLDKSAAAAPPPGRLTCSWDWPSLRETSRAGSIMVSLSPPQTCSCSQRWIPFLPSGSLPARRFPGNDFFHQMGMSASVSAPALLVPPLRSRLPEHPSPAARMWPSGGGVCRASPF